MAPVGAVPTEGTEALGVVPDEALAVAESREAMAEASLALCTTRDPKLTARITLCTPILEELGREVRLCDGKTKVGSPLERDAAALLAEFEHARGMVLKPPIPVEDIGEKQLKGNRRELAGGGGLHVSVDLADVGRVQGRVPERAQGG